MKNGYYEVHELEFAAAGRGDRDGKAAIRAELERRRAAKPDPALVRWMDRETVASRRRRAEFARFAALEATKSLCRRAERAQREQERRETQALIARAELWLAAPLTDMGQILAAARRAGW